MFDFFSIIKDLLFLAGYLTTLLSSRNITCVIYA